LETARLFLEMVVLPDGQPSLQHYTNKAFMIEWTDEILSSVKGT
jgi:hypothetical protein